MNGLDDELRGVTGVVCMGGLDGWMSRLADHKSNSAIGTSLLRLGSVHEV